MLKYGRIRQVFFFFGRAFALRLGFVEAGLFGLAALCPLSAFAAIRKLYAVRIAPSSTSSLTLARTTCVIPIRPHPPAMGTNTSGNSPANIACCSGVIIKFPYPCFADASVQKIRPPTRKSGLPMCELSSAPGMLSAIRRKSLMVIAIFNLSNPLALLPNLARNVSMNFSSARAETISSGENPLRHARKNVSPSKPIVIAKFGQAFKLHCPLHIICPASLNGARYGIGH